MLLLTWGADVNTKNHDKLTAFDLATRVGVPEITRLLAPNTDGFSGNRNANIEELQKKMNGSKVKNILSPRQLLITKFGFFEVKLTFLRLNK